MKRSLEILFFVLAVVVLILVVKTKIIAFYYNQAEGYAGRGLYAQAVDSYKKSIALDHSLIAAHYSLGNAYLELGMKKSAESEFRRSISLKRDFVPAFEALVHMYLQDDAYPQAMETLAEARSVCPADGKIEELFALVKFSHLTGLLKEGTEAFTSGRKSRAYELLNEALLVNPEYVFTYYLLGYLYFSERNYPLAKEMMDKTLRLDIKFYPARKLLGDIYFEEGKFNNALAEYNAALSVDRKDTALLNSAALSYMNLEKYEQAILLLKEALLINPGNVNLQYSLACLYRDSGRSREAVSGYLDVISMDTAFPNVHNDLAGVYKTLGRPELALEEYREGVLICSEKLAANPDNPFLLSDMAAACNGSGKYADAMGYINKAIAVKGDYPQAYLILADIHKNLGNLSAAQDALQKAGQLTSRKYVFIEKMLDIGRKQLPEASSPQ
ncbi:MAG: tetratricopeptide repeat protein [Candidatus Omnitrophota bacterium]|jgi:tetratricopeptide (TPR) repeat protein